MGEDVFEHCQQAIEDVLEKQGTTFSRKDKGRQDDVPPDGGATNADDGRGQ